MGEVRGRLGDLNDHGGGPLKYAGGAAVLLLAAWLVLPALVLNLGAVYLRDLAMDRAAGPMPWVVRELPLGKNSPGGAWFAARVSRLLESKGESPAAVPPITYLLIARAFSEGRLHPHTQMEAELVAWSCTTAAMAERCGPRLQQDWPDMSGALSDTGIVSAVYVDELNGASGAKLGAALAAKTVDCRRGLDFLRRWVGRDGFRPSQLAASRSLAGACPVDEAHFYRARAADLTGLRDEAAVAYGDSHPAQHPEAAFWYEDFQARRAQGARPSDRTIDRRTFDAQELPARFEDGRPMDAAAVVEDRAAPGGRARRATAFGAVLAHGPYIRLPYGRYRVSFFVQGGGAAGSGRMLRLDVREDSESWRPYTWTRTLGAPEPAIGGYQRIDHEFTSTGEDSFSIAVVALTNRPVAFARVTLESLGRE